MKHELRIYWFSKFCKNKKKIVKHFKSVQPRHKERDCVSNHRRLDCLFSLLQAQIKEKCFHLITSSYMSHAQWSPYCSSLNALTYCHPDKTHGFLNYRYLGMNSDIGLAPSNCQVMKWTNYGKLHKAWGVIEFGQHWLAEQTTSSNTNVDLLSIGTLGTDFSEILIKLQTVSLKKMHKKKSSAQWGPLCSCLRITVTS